MNRDLRALAVEDRDGNIRRFKANVGSPIEMLFRAGSTATVIILTNEGDQTIYWRDCDESDQ